MSDALFLVVYAPICPQCDDETEVDDGFTCHGCELFWPNHWSPAEAIQR